LGQYHAVGGGGADLGATDVAGGAVNGDDFKELAGSEKVGFLAFKVGDA